MKITKAERATLQAIRDNGQVYWDSEIGQAALKLLDAQTLLSLSKRGGRRFVRLTLEGIRAAEPPKRGRPASSNGPTPQVKRMASSIATREKAGGRRLNIMLSPQGAANLKLVRQFQSIPVSITATIEHALKAVAAPIVKNLNRRVS